MSKNEANVLGYIELETGSKLITPMNDVFLNYTFNIEENWEDLREIVNIFYRAYIKIFGDTKVRPTEGEIKVKTQFPQYRDFTSSKPMEQDIQIESTEKIDLIEVQNEMYPTIPIPKRSSEYFGFSLTRGEDKQKSSMWLLNGTIPELLNGKAFSNYVLMDEEDHRRHPIDSNILYVDLKKLAKMETQVGELAGVLTGVVTEPKDKTVRAILHRLRQNFKVFKNDTEVQNIMSRAEHLKAEGEAKGKAESEARLLPLLDEKDEQLSEKDEQLSEKDEQLSEKDEQLSEKDEQLSEKDEQLSEKDEQLSEKDEQLSEKDERIAELEAMLESITAQ